MDISVSGQAAALAGALLLGFLIGLAYDLLRIPRAYIRIPLLGETLDLLFWLAATAALFFYAVYAGNGEVRIYMALALMGGATVYFLALSHWVRALSGLMVAAVTAVVKIMLLPFVKAAEVLKKIQRKFKNSFSSRWKRYKMRQISGDEEVKPQGKRKERGRRRWWQARKRQDS